MWELSKVRGLWNVAVVRWPCYLDPQAQVAGALPVGFAGTGGAVNVEVLKVVWDAVAIRVVRIAVGVKGDVMQSNIISRAKLLQLVGGRAEVVKAHVRGVGASFINERPVRRFVIDSEAPRLPGQVRDNVMASVGGKFGNPQVTVVIIGEGVRVGSHTVAIENIVIPGPGVGADRL